MKNNTQTTVRRHFKYNKLFRFLLVTFIGLISFTTQAQNDFITTWEMTPGFLELTIPTNTDDYTYSYSVNFGDGTILTNQAGNATHEYASPGAYTVSISGVFPQLDGSEFENGNEFQMQSVEQWGNIQWLSMDRAFKDCQNLIINATDTPDLSQVTSTRGMFDNAQSLNQNLNNWDVSNVTNMYAMFLDAVSFNQPLNNWDVSNVFNMSAMFESAESFNQPLDNWDVSSVTDMGSMFRETVAFDQPLNNWDVSNVTDMRLMFRQSVSFNQALNNWDVSNVIWMMDMFGSTVSFDQPIDNWDVTSVISMEGMFSVAESFDQALNNWDVSNVTTMTDMFRQTDLFNQALNNWDVSNVTSMYNMFRAAAVFNQPLDNWDVSSTVNMRWMFRDAVSFNQPLNNWDVSNVFNMKSMFENATNFNQDLSNWNITTEDLNGFLDDSGMNTDNYDLFLGRLVQLGLQNGNLGADNIYYCDVTARQQLINAGWGIADEGLGANCNLSLNDFNSEDISIYPNPAKDIVHINSSSPLHIESISLYSITGKRIKTFNNTERLNLEEISQGIYLLQINTDKASYHKKLVKE